MPDAMQKKSAQSDNSALRKRPKTDDLSDIQTIQVIEDDIGSSKDNIYDQ